MLRLLVLRHAKAERGTPSGGDHARKLEPQGRTDAAKMGAYMAQQRLVPDYIIVSSATRTRETWDLAASALPAAPGAHIEDELYNASTQDIVQVVKHAPASAKAVVIVGHNPGFHDVSLTLSNDSNMAAAERLQLGLPTTGLVVIDFDIDHWSEITPGTGTIERFVTPASIAAQKS